MIAGNLEADTERIKHSGERAVITRTEIGNKIIVFASLYAPTGGDDEAFREVVMNVAAQLAEHSDDGAELIVAGDLNVNDNSTRVRKEIFAEMKLMLSLTEHRPPGPTFEFGDSGFSSLDMFLTTPGISVKQVWTEPQLRGV